MASTCIAIIYGTRGGLGDVGKFAATQAFKDPTITARIIAMSASSKESKDKGIGADVKNEQLNEELKNDMNRIPITYIDVESDSAQGLLEEQFDGVNAVVSCLGNRQPGYARWLAPGARKVVAAMKKKSVARLVQLSSFGIGDDYMPSLHPIAILWGTMLRTNLSSARVDLREMEAVVQESNLDYLLVRTVGIAPELDPEGKWKILTSKNDGRVTYSIAKPDVAAFMLQEAISPTLSSRGVTIGRDPLEAGN